MIVQVERFSAALKTAQKRDLLGDRRRRGVHLFECIKRAETEADRAFRARR